MSASQSLPRRFLELPVYSRLFLCLLTILLFLPVGLGLLPHLGKRLEDAVNLARYNSNTGGFDTRVQFWGKVVDQDGQPLEGSVIKAIATTLRMVKVVGGYREYEIMETRSAADGSFRFDGAEGFSLTIRQVSKDGYVLPSAFQAGTRWEGARYFYRYRSIGNMQSVFRPDPSQPVIFHLWRLNMPEPLVICGEGAGLSGIDFMVGAPPKDLRFFSMTVTDVGTPESPEWEVTVEALEPDGGVVKADPSDIFMFEAPAAGYTHSIKFRYGPDGTDQGRGDPGAPIRFFTRSHRGRWHAANEYAFFAPKEDGRVLSRMRYWLNPNGSRNLEHDAAHPLPEPRLTE